MKKIILVILALGLTTAAYPREKDPVYFVGTDTQGVPIQQVEWLYRAEELKEKLCPIWAGTIVYVTEEKGGAAKIQCDQAALPRDGRWRKAIGGNGMVSGWLDKKLLIKVKPKDLSYTVEKEAQE